MTIGIDIRALGSGVRSGIEEYIERLLEHLLPLDPKIQYKLFYSSWKNEVPDYPWMHLPNVQLKKLRIPNRALFLAAKILNQPPVDKLIGGADVFFFPHFFLAPLSVACKRVTTFHDLSHVLFPEFFPWRRRLWHSFMNPGWQARMSDRVIVVSDSTKQDVVSTFHIDPAKVYPVLSSVEPIHPWSVERLKQFRIDRRLPERFILSLGTLEPRKNIPGIIQAFDLVASRKECADVHLVIVGRRGWLWQDVLDAVRQSPYGDRIHFKDAVSAEERSGYYQSASVFMAPSFLEGYGFPPVEAMAHGTPVVASANSSFPEVVADGALLVDPYNVRQIADSVLAVLADQRLRELLAEKGKKRATTWSWDQSAAKTLEVLTTV